MSATLVVSYVFGFCLFGKGEKLFRCAEGITRTKLSVGWGIDGVDYFTERFPAVCLYERQVKWNVDYAFRRM